MLVIQNQLILLCPVDEIMSALTLNTRHPCGLPHLGPAIAYGVLGLPNLTENGNPNAMT